MQHNMQQFEQFEQTRTKGECQDYTVMIISISIITIEIEAFVAST